MRALKGTVKVYRAHTDEELVDPLTKGITRKKVLNTSHRICVTPCYPKLNNNNNNK